LNMPLKEESGKHFNVPPIRWWWRKTVIS
jgi:hypothetical protein